MQNLLNQLQACISERFPSMAASMNPGATDSEIAILERHVGISLPKQFHELYRWHNGQADEPRGRLGLFFGLDFIPIPKIIKYWDLEYRTLSHSTPSDLIKWSMAYTCLPAETIKRNVWNCAWIPISDDGSGNYLGMDFDPDTLGQGGQIISFGGREFTRVRAADDISGILGKILLMYTQNQYELIEEDEDDFRIATISPSTDHFLDYLRLKAERNQV